MSIISEFFYLQQRYQEAEMPCKECVRQLRRQLGDLHYEHLLRVNLLSSIYSELIDIESNEQLLRSVVPTLVDTNPSESGTGVSSSTGAGTSPADYNLIRLILINNFAVILTAQKNYLDAEKYIETSLSLFRKSFGVNDTRTLAVESNAAIYSIHARDYIEAEKRLVACLDRQRQILGQSHIDTLNTEFILGCLLLFRHRYGEAEPLLVHAYEQMKTSLGREDEQTQMAGTYLVELLKNLPPNVE